MREVSRFCHTETITLCSGLRELEHRPIIMSRSLRRRHTTEYTALVSSPGASYSRHCSPARPQNCNLDLGYAVLILVQKPCQTQHTGLEDENIPSARVSQVC
ncbi:hypothetical protein PoB_005767100 [Plakobranchus ocellatus]|uniref:Uncharacterized protein n=1 Tax=Plakobranchus ocellatus TaxID=259542 RepID=A0AAV4C7A5_9GAST|nr:hypothetical protein PoB_005767100 [Plakobranchus ocellatus]